MISRPPTFALILSGWIAQVSLCGTQPPERMTLRAPQRLGKETNATFNRLRDRAVAIRDFIEGQPNSSEFGGARYNPCVFYDSLSDEPLSYDTRVLLWRKPDGTESVDVVPAGRHVYGKGLPTVLENNRPAPHCFLHGYQQSGYFGTHLGCPCCLECVVAEQVGRHSSGAPHTQHGREIVQNRSRVRVLRPGPEREGDVTGYQGGDRGTSNARDAQGPRPTARSGPGGPCDPEPVRPAGERNHAAGRMVRRCPRTACPAPMAADFRGT